MSASRGARSDSRRGLGWAVAAAFWAALFVLPWKAAAAGASAKVNVVLMLGCAAVFNTLAWPLQRGSGGGPGRLRGIRLWVLTIQLSLVTLLGNWLSSQAVAHMSAPVFSVVLRSEALWVALLGFVLLGERVDRLFWPGLGFLGVGLWLLQVVGGQQSASELGLLYGIGAAVSFSFIAVLVRKHIAALSPVGLNALRLWCAVASWFVLNGFAAELRAVSLRQLGYAAAAALFGPTLSRLCAMMSARYVPAWTTALVSQSTPLFTFVLAFLWLGEVPSRGETIGGALVLCGVVLPVISRVRRP